MREKFSKYDAFVGIFYYENNCHTPMSKYWNMVHGSKVKQGIISSINQVIFLKHSTAENCHKIFNVIKKRQKEQTEF